jgi:selenide,water dikinase
VFGTVHPQRVVRNVGARAGDSLLLTKPLGTGILLTAFKNGLLDDQSLRPVVESMLALNRAASEAMREVGVSAATDVTGFGLLGHLGEMLRASDVGARLDLESVPLLPLARELAERDVVPGGTRRNLAAVEELVDWPGDLGPAWRLLLADAQTSGGLLIAVAAERAGALGAALEQRGVSAAWIGAVRAGPVRIAFA